MINISLAYVPKNRPPFYQEWQVAKTATIIMAIGESDFCQHEDFTEFMAWAKRQDLAAAPSNKAWFVGIFSQKKALNTPLKEGDRIEIYRPLIKDPMAIRKQKVGQKDT